MFRATPLLLTELRSTIKIRFVQWTLLSRNSPGDKSNLRRPAKVWPSDRYLLRHECELEVCV